MKEYNITRKDIINVFIRALEPLDFICALWEAGAASFDRVDEWSDIDLCIVVEDDGVEKAFAFIEQTLSDLAEIDMKYRLPEPTWHGHSQIFYRLKKTSPFLFLDIVVMKRTRKDKFLQYKIHGEPVVHFDKIAVVKDDPVDPVSFFNKIKTRLQTLKINFTLFQVLVLKELNRGNDIEALSYYISCTYRPLIEVLRIKYCPYHHNFFTSYAYYDLPSEVTERLYKLYFVDNPEHLRKCRDAAEVWFWEVIKDINYDDLKKEITQPIS